MTPYAGHLLIETDASRLRSITRSPTGWDISHTSEIPAEAIINATSSSLTSTTSQKVKYRPHPPHQTGRLRQVCRFLHQNFFLIRHLRLLFLSRGTSRLKSEGCISGSQKNRRVRRTSARKNAYPVGHPENNRAVKTSPVGIFGGCHPGKHGRQSGLPISRASLRAKFSSP